MKIINGKKIIEKLDILRKKIFRKNTIIFNFEKKYFDIFLDWCYNLHYNKNFKDICIRDIYWFFWFKKICIHEDFFNTFSCLPNFPWDNELFCLVQFLKLIYHKYKTIKVYKFESPDFIIIADLKAIGLEITKFYDYTEYEEKDLRKGIIKESKNVRIISNNLSIIAIDKNKLIDSANEAKKNIIKHLNKKNIYLKNVIDKVISEKIACNSFETILFVNSAEAKGEWNFKDIYNFFICSSNEFNFKIIWLYPDFTSSKWCKKIFNNLWE